jgi:predicted DNA-binding transcriptional regulator AlpA
MPAKNHLVTDPGGVEYLDAPQVRERYGNRSAMWLWRLRKNDGDFPKPMRIANRNYWRIADLCDYENLRRMPDATTA